MCDEHVMQKCVKNLTQCKDRREFLFPCRLLPEFSYILECMCFRKYLLGLRLYLSLFNEIRWEKNHMLNCCAKPKKHVKPTIKLKQHKMPKKACMRSSIRGKIPPKGQLKAPYYTWKTIAIVTYLELNIDYKISCDLKY